MGKAIFFKDLNRFDEAIDWLVLNNYIIYY